MFNVMMAEWEWPNPPRVLTCAPLSHSGAALALPALLKGGTMLVLPGFEPVAVMQAIQEHRINCTLVVPTMIYALLDHPRFGEFDLSSLETVFYGASSISPARLKEAIERIGPVFSQFYGQAEVPMVITLLRKSEHDVNDLRRLASCGRPTPWAHVSLLDAEDRPVPDGEPGEICVRGPLVFDGYRNNPELNAATFRGGWHHTGDVAVRDPGGFLRIVDRTKDMIVSGGFNIYPREIEDILSEHPAVAQAAVIGMPHPKWGEAVTAVVVLRPGLDVTAEVSDRHGRRTEGLVPGAEDRDVRGVHSADAGRQTGQEGTACEVTAIALKNNCGHDSRVSYRSSIGRSSTGTSTSCVRRNSPTPLPRLSRMAQPAALAPK